MVSDPTYFDMDGNIIHIRTLDLSKDWKDIRDELIELVS